MLKIKDNVDLKELEKFGFEYFYSIYDNPVGMSYYPAVDDYIEFWLDNKIIEANGKLATAVVYDLIKADLVEEEEFKC